MKRFYKMFTILALILLVFSNSVLATEENTITSVADEIIENVVVVEKDTYKLTKEMIFVNKRNFALEMGYAEIMIGQKDLVSYQDDTSLTITPKPDSISEDEYGNLYAYYDMSGYLPGAKLKVTVTKTFTTSEYEPLMSSRINTEINDENRIYLEPQTRVQSNHSMIENKAEELTEGLTTDYKKALAIYEYVNSTMEYVSDSTYANRGALSAIKTHKGVCEEYATLFTALCRASDIPSRIIAGYKVETKTDKEKGTTSTELINHVWCEIYFEDIGWVPVEPTVVASSVTTAISRAFGRIDGADYIALAIYNVDKASRLMQYVTEESFKEYVEKVEIEPAKERNKFNDITQNYDWATSSIENLFQMKVIEGYSENEYGPERNISRIEFICMLSRTLKYMDVAVDDDGAPYYNLDYDKLHWSKDEYDYLMYCYQAITPSDGITSGYNNIADVFDTAIQMNKPITRAEVVALMNVFLRPTKGTNQFSDIGGHRFYDSIIKSAANGLIIGYPDGSFKPNSPITRAEMAVVLDRYINNMIYDI